LHLNISNAISCGLLPNFLPAQIEVVGNTSLAGALAVLLDRTLLPELETICARLRTVELNLHPDFEDTYIDNLSLP
jgi:uncharacterized 2Fe-2S/4Fe-4S cluster protein (DUF4445 family)